LEGWQPEFAEENTLGRNAAGRDSQRFEREPGRLPANRSGIPPFIYAAKVKVK
jgi:hypothetical protein